MSAQEQAWGLVVSVGGQIPQNLAKPLHDRGARVLGTSPDDIDRAEDRHKFSSLLDDLGVDQPPWRELQSVKDAQAFAAEVEYPVLVRPSFVLSGAAMKVATSDSELAAFLGDAADVSPDHPVVVSKFIRNAKEIEFDAVCRDGTIMNYAISEHVENAGVHSGDATLVLPAQKLYVQTQKQVKRAAAKIAEALNISGPVNIQFMARDNDVKVIECNLRWRVGVLSRRDVIDTTRLRLTMPWVVSFFILSRFGPRRGRRGVSERARSRRWRKVARTDAVAATASTRCLDVVDAAT